MVMGQDEAITKWCPLGRIAGEYDAVNESLVVVANRDCFGSESHFHTRCLGSKCMAWRWHDPSGVADLQRRGYCGAFGEPK